MYYGKETYDIEASIIILFIQSQCKDDVSERSSKCLARSCRMKKKPSQVTKPRSEF